MRLSLLYSDKLFPSRLLKTFGLLLVVLLSCGKQAFSQSEKEQVQLYIDNLFEITQIMVSDVTAPTGAARFYAYSTLGAYMALDKPVKLPNNFTGSFRVPLIIDRPGKVDIKADFAALYCMLRIGEAIMPSGKRLEAAKGRLMERYRVNRWMSKKEMVASISYAEQIADQVIAYSKTDGYSQLSALPRYSPSEQVGTWYPTPPAYLGAIDPEWRTIRPFFLRDLSQFKPIPPAPFDMDSTSSFYTQMMEVHSVSKKLTSEQRLIANFWDCNPFMVSYSGHMAIGLKKISPGGHWVSITGIAALKAGFSLAQTLEAHALVSTGLHDAFISCWEEKYDSDRIRPETAINKYIDNQWRPILQTPPFPEYTSGHSVISRTSAVLLTWYFDQTISYTDSSEEYFGLPARKFKSFLQASDEAAISRLYGGIHFRDAIEEGVRQGAKIGEFIIGHVDSKSLSNN
ncbi:hypothetical protein GCM10007049_24350 [Echinicola pacifica]|uniref:Phosphatidic acid phosphatase type 2/haloperoxidase domain-containing protein n=1 Tax=Echinicola pacifica TaxID=346377 RepID=A0A918USA1_9BACT|nr:vanadium-dependent haloperoxidase [Echinicola pacifica]GGZ30633.1 hypothetical protein GCM10007049_24350 [Echinicola pacifica]